MDDISDLFERLALAYLACLEQFLTIRRGRLAGFLDLRTYGTYLIGSHANDQALMQWAVDRDVPAELTLPGTPKVLLCVDALARRAARETDAEIRERLRSSVLIHEHFHAAVASTVGSDPILADQVASARSLEEALAVWLELHAARDSPAFTALIKDYAAVGEYPQWPYAGALMLEQIYERDGLPPIQRFINRLVSDPSAAADRFERVLNANRYDS